MKSWKVYVTLALVFVSGMMIGAAGSALYIKHRVNKFIEGGPPAVRAVVLKRLTGELGLDQGQRAEMERLVEAAQARLMELRLENEPLVKRIVEEALAESRGFLTPSQREKAEELWARVRARWLLSEKPVYR